MLSRAFLSIIFFTSLCMTEIVADEWSRVKMVLLRHNKSLKKKKNCEELYRDGKLVGLKLTDAETIKPLIKLSASLESLELISSDRKFIVKDLEALNEIRALESIILRKQPNAKDLSFISKHRRLEILKLWNCREIKKLDGIEADDFSIASLILGSCVNIEDLSAISSWKIERLELNRLLSLKHLPRLADTGVVRLFLRKLNIARYNFANNFPQLESLEVKELDRFYLSDLAELLMIPTFETLIRNGYEDDADSLKSRYSTQIKSHQRKLNKKKKKQEEQKLIARKRRALKDYMSFSAKGIQPYLVVIKNKAGGSGSGFVAEDNGKTYVYTNQHVALGSEGQTFKTPLGDNLKPLSYEMSEKRDIIRFEIEKRDALKFRNDEPSLNEPIAVYGNSAGGGVATELFGRVWGYGSTKIEISAPFVPGNSGSPIVNGDMEIVGIVSYVLRPSLMMIENHEKFLEKKNKKTKEKKSRRKKRKDDEMTTIKKAIDKYISIEKGWKTEQPFTEYTRRLGYRFNDVVWKKYNWKTVNKAAAQIKELEKQHDTIDKLIDIWRSNPLKELPQDMATSSSLRSWIRSHNRFCLKINDTSVKIDTNKKIKMITSDYKGLMAACDKISKKAVSLKKKYGKNLTGYLKKTNEDVQYQIKYIKQSIKTIGEYYCSKRL